MGPDPLGPVYIGAREIYDALQKATGLLERTVERIDGHDETQKDHEIRLRALERARWPLPTLSVLIALAALVLAFLQKR